tara:strand:- start:733 stop:966 length:234 start_codon:yes stop_codon:yes gene_type:complete
MERFKNHPISTVLGLFFIAIALMLLFVETNYDLPLWSIGLIAVLGILLCFAKDKLIDLLTLGLSRFIKDTGNKVLKN